MEKPILCLFFCSLLLYSCHPPNNTIPPNLSADIQPFLERYFASWSNRDMETYRSCFHEKAVVIKLSKGKVDWAMELDEFVERQTKYLSQTNGPVSEQMTSFTANEDAQCATVIVKWVFEGEGETGTGVDRFSLIRNADNRLQIVALVWYKDER